MKVLVVFDLVMSSPPRPSRLPTSSIERGAIAEGVDDVEGAREVEGVIEERALESVAVLDGIVDVGRGM
jgi:hypothetical protein